MTQMVYSDPTYLHDGPCATILSETRNAKLSSSALHFFNATIDELLHVITHASLLSFSSSSSNSSTPSPSGTPSAAYSTPSPLEPNQVLSIDRFKSALQRVIGPHLGKECILESEIAIRELLRRGGSGLKRDPALQQSKSNKFGIPDQSQTNEGSIGVARQSEEIFKGLREWVMRISGLGALCPRTGPANLTTHLSELSAHRNPPSPSSPHISFLLALYIERSLTTLATHLLQSISSVMSRSSHSDIATTRDLEVAFGEDESIWSWFQGMRVRGAIEEEGRIEQERLRSPTMGSSFAFQQQQQRGGMRLGSLSNGISSRTSSDSHNTSRKQGGPPLHYRKNSLALSVVPSMNSSRSDDPFDQLLQSGETMKLSMTPDRLQLMEKAERARKASALNLRSSSVSPIAAPITIIDSSVPLAPPIVHTNSSMSMRRKLQARGPQQKDLFNEEDEDSVDTDLDTKPKRGGTKESLMDLLASPPPWAGLGFDPSSRGGRESTSPTSTDMRSQGSQSTVASGMTGATTESSGGEEAYLNRNPEKRQRGLKAKDEKRDLASERQVNTDLMNFFRNSPPATSPVVDQNSLFPPNGAPASPPLGGKRSKGGLRGFMSKVTGGSNSSQRRPSADESAALVMTPPFALPMDPPPPPAARTSLSDNRPPRMRSISAQSNKSLGASSQGTTTYALPPGLGDTPGKDKERKRARKRTVSAEVAKLQMPSPRPYSPPLIAQTDQPPISILKPNFTSDTSPPPPHLPSSTLESRPSIARPQRSSSLKRRVRSRESSAATTSSIPPPTVIVPTGLAISDLDSMAYSTSRSHGHSSQDEREETTTETDREDTIAPSRSRSDGSLTPQPLKLRQLLLVDSRRNSAGNTAVQPELSPVNETTSSSPPTQPRQVSPVSYTLVDGSEQSNELVNVLEELRIDMNRVRTRQECVDLVDTLIASRSTRVADSKRGEQEEGMEGRMVEYFLS